MKLTGLFLLGAAIATAAPREKTFPASAVRRLSCVDSLVEYPDFARYLSSIDGLREAMRRDRFPILGVRRAFYAMAGFDAALLARLFPRADVIAVDKAPVYPRGTLRASELPSRQGVGGYYVYPERGEFTGPRVVGALEDAGFRIVEIRVFSEAGNLHAEIRFDSGPDTRVRSYWQIRDEFPAPGSWWMDLLDDRWLPDVVMAKGAHHLLQQNEDVIRWLRRSRGMVIEGFNTTRYAREGRVMGEFSGIVRADELSPGRAYVFPGRFGYGDCARVLRFDDRLPASVPSVQE